MINLTYSKELPGLEGPLQLTLLLANLQFCGGCSSQGTDECMGAPFISHIAYGDKGACVIVSFDGGEILMATAVTLDGNYMDFHQNLKDFGFLREEHGDWTFLPGFLDDAVYDVLYN